MNENEVNGIIIDIDDWDEIIPGIEQSLCDLYDYEYPDYLGLPYPTPEEYLHDPEAYRKKHNLPSFERFLIEKDYVKHIEEVYRNQDSTYKR